MDPSLWLLLKLRSRGTARRWKQALRRPKGIVLAVVTGVVFLPGVLMLGFSQWFGFHPPIEPIRRYAPLALMVFTFAALMFSAGEQSLYYTPAEVTFLFAGPYRKRQLLAYKLVTTLMLCLVSALFFAMSGSMGSPSPVSAFVGSFLLLLFFQTLQMVMGLALSTLGRLAVSRGRMLVMAGLGVAVALAVGSVGRDLLSEGLPKILERVEGSSAASVVLSPFRWFVRAFTADRASELARWGSLCLMMDLALLGLVFLLDASFLEASANASARRFAKMRRMIGGGGGIRAGARGTGRFRFRPPAAPWWGGVGPNLWRQMTTALGDPSRFLGLIVLMALLPAFFGYLARQDPKTGWVLIYVSEAMVVWMSMAVSGLLPYDFRGDVDVMEELKTLPIAPSRMALGQVLTPALVVTVLQTVTIAAAIVAVGPDDVAAWTVLAFLFPANLLFYAVENLLFLWYPSRMVAGQFDILAVGRQLLLLGAKGICLIAGLMLASVVAAAGYFATGGSLPVALALGWLVLLGSALAVVPLVGRAFVRFDVAREVPA